MNGYPKNLNTKADYEYVRQHFAKNVWEKDFQNLLATEKDWFNVGEISDDGVEDDTHRVVTMKNEDQEETGKKYQYEYKVNPNCKLYRIGYTAEDVKNILDSESTASET